VISSKAKLIAALILNELGLLEKDWDVQPEFFLDYWHTRTVIAGGLLHCMNRFALPYAGTEFKEQLHDYVASEAVKQMVHEDWAEDAKSHSDPKGWLQEGYDETLYNVVTIERQLIGCETIGDTDMKGDVFNGNPHQRGTVFGELAWYLCQNLGFGSDIEFPDLAPQPRGLPVMIEEGGLARMIVYTAIKEVWFSDSRLSDVVKSAADSWCSHS
ncbi:uncharacterized protein METZ01_LOCUS506050, partial [marine metagenome]